MNIRGLSFKDLSRLLLAVCLDQCHAHTDDIRGYLRQISEPEVYLTLTYLPSSFTRNTKLKTRQQRVSENMSRIAF